MVEDGQAAAADSSVVDYYNTPEEYLEGQHGKADIDWTEERQVAEMVLGVEERIGERHE